MNTTEVNTYVLFATHAAAAFLGAVAMLLVLLARIGGDAQEQALNDHQERNN